MNSKLTASVLITVLVNTLVLVGMPVSSAAVAKIGHLYSQSRVHHKQGPDVAKRVRDLQKYNKNVRRALAEFAKNLARNGHQPRVDDAQEFVIDPAGGAAALKPAKDGIFRRAVFNPQTPDYSGYGLDAIMVPTYEAPGQWQGTFILDEYDPSGYFLGEYVADVVITPDSTLTELDVNLEISFEDGYAYLEYGDVSGYDNLGYPYGGGYIQPVISSNSAAKFQRVNFTPQLNPYRLGQRIGGANPRLRNYVRCTWGGSAGAGVGCGILGLVSGGSLLPDCLLVGVATANGTCAAIHFFGLG